MTDQTSVNRWLVETMSTLLQQTAGNQQELANINSKVDGCKVTALETEVNKDTAQMTAVESAHRTAAQDISELKKQVDELAKAVAFMGDAADGQVQTVPHNDKLSDEDIQAINCLHLAQRMPKDGNALRRGRVQADHQGQYCGVWHMVGRTARRRLRRCKR